MRLLPIIVLLFVCCKPEKHLVESYMPYVYANYAAKNDLEILAVYKDSLHQVYFDVELNRQYIKCPNGSKIYLIRK